MPARRLRSEPGYANGSARTPYDTALRRTCSGPANYSGVDGPQGHQSDDPLSACVSEALAGSHQSSGRHSGLRPSTLTALAEVTQTGMNRPTVEVADLLRTHGDRFVRENRSWAQLSAVEGVARYSALPHTGFGRPSRSVFGVRTFDPLRQLLPYGEYFIMGTGTAEGHAAQGDTPVLLSIRIWLSTAPAVCREAGTFPFEGWAAQSPESLPAFL